jgi:hypothetical protein
MQKLTIVVMAALLATFAGVREARAGLITLQPVSGKLEAFQTPSNVALGINKNDVIPGLWGYLNGDLVLNGTAGTDYLVEFTLIGSESGWTNKLLELQGGTELVEPADITKTISYIHEATGAANDFLKFQFKTLPNPVKPYLVNGVDPDNGGSAYVKNGGSAAALSFFVSFCIDTADLPSEQKDLLCNFKKNAKTGDIAWLAFDDSGAGPNNDHDDWVGIVKVTEVPVPDGGATAGLLVGVLGCLSLLRKRFNA